MRILVIGALEKQAAMLRSEFPQLDLRFSNKDSHTVPDETMRNADRILCLANFVTHGLYWKIPREKMTLVRGGMTKLRHALQTLAIIDKIDIAPQAVCEHGIPTQLPCFDCTGEEDFLSNLKWSPIKSLAPGEQYVLPKPNELKTDVFKARVQRIRHDLGYKEGIKISLEFDQPTTGCIVTRLADVDPNEVRTDNGLDGAEQTVALLPETAAPKRLVAKHRALGAPYGSSEVVEYERSFWVRTFEYQLHNGKNYKEATDGANTALAALRENFR
jgi:hypothetical protein